MRNDLHIFTHAVINLTRDTSVGQSVENADFQTNEEVFIIDNRVTTAPLLVDGTDDELLCTLTTGQFGGNELINQNQAADANRWLPALNSADTVEEVARLRPTQRVSFNYAQTPGGLIDAVPNIQTAFVGHYHDRSTTPQFDLIRPMTVYSKPLLVAAGGSQRLVINIDPAYDMLVRAFFCRSPRLGVLVNISDRQYNLMNEPVFADLIAYRTFAEVQNFRMPFLPWIATRGHRYFVDVTNISGTDAIVDFAFWGHLANYPVDALD